MKSLISAYWLLPSCTVCNTVQGSGEDLEAGGEKIQDEAVEHK